MDEDFVQLDIGSKDCGSLAVFDGLGSNVVAVVIIEDQQVVVALARREGELAGKITVAFAGGGAINDSCKQVVRVFAFLEGSRKEIRIREQRKSGRFWFCGLLVLPGLLQVGLGCDSSVGSAFAERVQGQTGENFELIGGSQGSLQGGGNRGAQGCMGEGYELFDLGGMKSRVGPVGRGSNSWGQANLPKAIGGGIEVAGEDGLVSVGHSHIILGESGNTVSIAELANGEKRAVNVVEDESLGGVCGEAGEGKGSNGGGKDGSAIGQRDQDGIILGGHIGKACCRKDLSL